MYSLWVSANDLARLSLSVQKYVINFTHTLRFNPYAAGTVYIRYQTNFKPINLTGIAKIFRGRCLVNLIITFWECIFFQKYKYFSSFEAGNCVSNSSFKWMKNNLGSSARERRKGRQTTYGPLDRVFVGLQRKHREFYLFGLHFIYTQNIVAENIILQQHKVTDIISCWRD